MAREWPVDKRNVNFNGPGMKTAEEIYEEHQPEHYGCGAYILPEDWQIQAMKAYAIELAKQTQINCATNAKTIQGNNQFCFFSKVDKDSILDEKNIPEI